jgi:hypothetical protein
MAPLDGGNFQGINPSMLQQLIKSLNSGVTGAQPLANSYVGQFTRVGLDTGAVQKLLADYAWASAQQPMLNRRYSLATHQPPGSWPGGWTTMGAGPLAYASTGAAKKAGTADAQQMQAYLDEHDWSGIQKELGNLTQNKGDADYMAAFFSQLGPTGLYALSLYAQGGGVSNADEQEVQEAVGNGLAAASYEMPLTDDFLQGIGPGEPEAATMGPYPGGWNTAALAPFLTEGEFSTQWLQTLSPTVLHQEGVEMGQQLPPGYDAIFQAIAGNPGYAAQFFQQNSTELSNYMTNPVLYNHLANDEGFGKFLEAATIPPKGATDTKPFTDNAKAFIQLFGDSGADTTNTVRLAMAQVTASYFPDLLATVTSPAPGATGPLGLNPSEWGTFVQDAMKNNESAAFLLMGYVNWKEQAVSSGNVKGAWQTFALGQLNNFFAANYKAANPSGGSTSTLKTILLDMASTGGAALLTSTAFAFAPEVAGPLLLGEAADASLDAADASATSAVAAEATEAEAAQVADAEADAGDDNTFKQRLTDATTAAFGEGGTDIFNQLGASLTVDGGAPAASAAALAQEVTGAQYNWVSAVTEAWNNGQITPDHTNVVAGKTYAGDPIPYEQKYGGSFMNSNGTLVSNFQDNPKALAAYNAWLQDPTVANAAWSTFNQTELGELANAYDTGASGGGG